jgi:hypothetical protein
MFNMWGPLIRSPWGGGVSNLGGAKLGGLGWIGDWFRITQKVCISRP